LFLLCFFVVFYRVQIAQLCPANEAAFTGTDPWACKTAPRKLVIYQRDRSRKLSNMDEALRLLGERFPAPEWSIQVRLAVAVGGRVPWLSVLAVDERV